MRSDLAMYRAVAQAREDICAGIEQSTAIRAAARRFNVSADAVAAYALMAHQSCCKAADIAESERRS